MITRFDLFVVLRNQVADRGRVRRALAVEAAMEELASVAGADAAVWGLAGLGADIDYMLARENPGRRGEVAEELLLTEGAPVEVAAAARAAVRGEAEQLSELAAALVVAGAVVDGIYQDLDDAAGLDAVDAMVVGRRIRKAAEKRGDEDAQRVLACAVRAGVEVERAAALAHAGMMRVRSDLRL
jgi:predicted hydrolase (HD superfamily)